MNGSEHVHECVGHWTDDGEWQVSPGEPIVRCRDCKHYYEVENYHPQGNYDSRCCKYFDTYNDEVEPDGFCAWGEAEEDER